MANQEKPPPESAKKKSGVVQSQNPSERDPAFEPGDKVKMVVRETWADGISRMVNKDFTVHNRRDTQGHWEYSLLVESNHSVWDRGRYFPETRLRAA